jgi:hypothetical protein
LNRISTYKQILAIALLAVYAFIATPIQYWHHHHKTSSSKSTSSLEDQKEIRASNSSINYNSDDCQICSHQYSVYANTEISLLAGTNQNDFIRKGPYQFTIPLSSCYLSINKGPPAQFRFYS